MNEEMTFKMVDENGKEKECEVLFTFESDETHKNYIVYTDNTTDESGNTRVYASIFDPKDPNSKLLPIDTEKEWSIIKTILAEIQNEVRESYASEQE
ncbi:MAG: DUF1292 domain-containing protein [Firmicutes bacterium]|nr:DUF1292 domain-containing protein [Bacillota bacterium]